MDAIIYARFSSLKQDDGDSITRQLREAKAFCVNKNFNVIEEVFDKGVSAYSGANIKTGNLSKLALRIEKQGGQGKVLLVHHLEHCPSTRR